MVVWAFWGKRLTGHWQFRLNYKIMIQGRPIISFDFHQRPKLSIGSKFEMPFLFVWYLFDTCMLYFDIFVGLEHGNSFKSLDLGQHIWVMQPMSVSKLIEFCWHDFICEVQSTDQIRHFGNSVRINNRVWRPKLTIETVPDREIEILVTEYALDVKRQFCHYRDPSQIWLLCIMILLWYIHDYIFWAMGPCIFS